MVKDAARYRYLRATTTWVSNSDGERIRVSDNPERWDQEIDACIAKGRYGSGHG